MENTEHMFLERLETNYFQVSNYIFDLDFKVKATKRKIFKNFYGNGKHKYETIEEKRGLSAHEKLVFIYLSRCANNGNSAFPSYNVISKNCNISRESAKLAIKVLFENQFIMKKNRGYTANRCKQVTCNYSNVYKINADLSKLPHQIRKKD